MEAEELRKEKRKRKKKLYNTIREQMEFYFSDANLNKDRFLSKLLNEVPDGYIDLEVFLRFNKIRKLTTDIREIVKALSTSEMLQLNAEKTKVNRITPLKTCDNVDDCTIYVENFPQHADHGWFKNYFSSFGQVTYVSLPKFKSTGQNKGFAFIEFANPDAVKRACEHFNMAKAPSQSPNPNPGGLYNEIVFEPPMKKRKIDPGDAREELPKHSSVSANVTKSIDSQFASPEDCQREETDNVQEKRKKKRKRHKKPKDARYEADNFYVVPKVEWKRLRNKYLSLQKANMTVLKKSLCLVKDNHRPPPALPTKKEEKRETVASEHFETGLIVKLILSKSITNAKEFKDSVQSEMPVAYIDMKIPENTVYIRCHNSNDSIKLLDSQVISQYGSAEVLKAEEETVYWNKLQAERNAKRGNKSRSKIRGREKIVSQAENLLAGPKHIYFN